MNRNYTVERSAKTAESGAHRHELRTVIWPWIEGFLLIVGIALAAVYCAARIESFMGSRAALKKFAALQSTTTVQNRDVTVDKSSPGQTSALEQIGLPEIDNHPGADDRTRPDQQSGGNESGDLLAVLRISKIHLEAPILDGTDNLTLNHAVGRIAGTARPGERGNIGIAGHRDGFFRGLKDLSVGDKIEIQTLNGIDTYVVDQIQIVLPNQVEVLQPRSVPSLTLVTCYPFHFFGNAPQRYVITASLSQEKRKAG